MTMCGVLACRRVQVQLSSLQLLTSVAICVCVLEHGGLAASKEILKDDGGTSVRLGVSDGRSATPKVRLGCHHSTTLWCVDPNWV